MTKTSSSNLQNQARPSPLQVHQETSSETIMQSSTSISRDLNDQKSNKDGLQHKVDEMGSKDHVCIIDVRNEEEKEKENKNDEKVCRICQLLSTDHLPAGAGNVNLVFLGCACRGELGISHYHCALVWFQQKGNRTCEICGKPAKNIAGIEDTGFRAYGTDIGIITTEIAMSHGSYPTDHRCSTSLSRFLLVAVVLAFVLPGQFALAEYYDKNYLSFNILSSIGEPERRVLQVYQHWTWGTDMDLAKHNRQHSMPQPVAT